MGIVRKDRYLKLWFLFNPCLIMAIPCPFTLFSTDKIIHSCQIGWVIFCNLQSLQFVRDTVFRLNFSCVRNHVLQLLIALYVLLRLPDKMQNDKYNYLPGLKVKTLLNTPRPCYGNEGSTALGNGSRYHIGWIFGKIPNGLWPPLIFGKLCCKSFIVDMLAYMQVGMGAR